MHVPSRIHASRVMFLPKRQKIVYSCSTSVSCILSRIVIKKKKKRWQLPSVFKLNRRTDNFHKLFVASLSNVLVEKNKNKAKNYERNNWSGKCVKFSSVILHFPFSPVVIARLDKRIVRVNLISGIKRIPFIDRYRRSIITLHLLAEIQRRVDIGRSF